MHPFLILVGKALIDSMPGMTPQISWTSVNLLYNAVCLSNSARFATFTHFLLVHVFDVPLGYRHSFSK